MCNKRPTPFKAIYENYCKQKRDKDEKRIVPTTIQKVYH